MDARRGQATLAHTRLRDQPSRDVGWIRAVMCSPGLLRVFAQAMPALAAQVYPAEAMPRVAGLAALFDTAPRAPATVER